MPFRYALLALVFLSFCSCEGLQGKLKLIQGNLFFSWGLYNEAVGAYMEARKDPAVEPYADFALGTAYLVLEHDEAALNRFDQAEALITNSGKADTNHNLLYDIAYNRGIIMFQKGEYEAAREDFRTALELKNSAIEAKRNLELSILSLYMKPQSSNIQEEGLGTVAEERDNTRSEIIFNFVRQKELDNWKSWEWAGPEEEKGPDY